MASVVHYQEIVRSIVVESKCRNGVVEQKVRIVVVMQLADFGLIVKLLSKKLGKLIDLVSDQYSHLQQFLAVIQLTSSPLFN